MHNPPNCQSVELYFRGEKMAKVFSVVEVLHNDTSSKWMNTVLFFSTDSHVQSLTKKRKDTKMSSIIAFFKCMYSLFGNEAAVTFNWEK